jgi:general secretion pathway protein G
MKWLLCTRAPARGMTLIEIMVVVFILGLMAAVVAINVVGTRDSAQIGTARAELSNLRTALDMYLMRKGRYPSTAEGLAALFEAGIVTGKPPKKDPWGNAYVYASPGTKDPRGYDLRSLGPDGQPSDDDVELE